MTSPKLNMMESEGNRMTSVTGRTWGYREGAVQGDQCKEQGASAGDRGWHAVGKREAHQSRAEGGRRGRTVSDAWIGSKLPTLLDAREGSLGQETEVSDSS